MSKTEQELKQVPRDAKVAKEFLEQENLWNIIDDELALRIREDQVGRQATYAVMLTAFQPKLAHLMLLGESAVGKSWLLYAGQRWRVAQKLQNPGIEEITFKTSRHFKGTIEYHRTRDILHVMQLLGHKNIRNTLVYTHLVNFETDEFVCKVAGRFFWQHRTPDNRYTSTVALQAERRFR